MPSHALDIEDWSVFRILLAHLSRYRQEEGLSQSKFVFYSKGFLEESGIFWAYARKLCEDLELIELAAPCENYMGKKLLESKILAEYYSNFS